MRDPSASGRLKLGLSLFSLLVTSVFLACSIPHLATGRMPRRLVVCLVACCFMIYVQDVYAQLTEDETSCKVAGFQSNLFDLAENLWALAIAHNLRQTVRNPLARRSRTIERRYHLVVWPTALALSAVPWLTDSYGDVGDWCWITSEGLGSVWRVACFYGVLWLGAPVLIYTYVDTGRYIASVKRNVNAAEDPTMYAVKKLLWMPLIYLVCRILPSANRINEMAGGDDIHWLSVGQGVSESLIGTLYVLVFFRRRIRAACCSKNGGEGGSFDAPRSEVDARRALSTPQRMRQIFSPSRPSPSSRGKPERLAQV